jgi:hypothetical protein
VSSEASEEPLLGGAVNVVVRVGDTVRRTPPENAGFVHRLLQHFAAVGWDGAPRFLGSDTAGRETLSYIPGHVDWDRARAKPLGDESLRQAARLTRAFHDLTAGTALAGADEVVCHNDLSPRNTVYRRPRSRAIRSPSSIGISPRPAAASTTSLTSAGSSSNSAPPIRTKPSRLGACASSPTPTAWGRSGAS